MADGLDDDGEQRQEVDSFHLKNLWEPESALTSSSLPSTKQHERRAQYVITVGSTGGPPVASGDSPDANSIALDMKCASGLHRIPLIPLGGSPSGAGESPAPPTVNRYRADRTALLSRKPLPPEPQVTVGTGVRGTNPAYFEPARAFLAAETAPGALSL